MNIKPIFRFRLRESLRSSAVVFGVLIITTLLAFAGMVTFSMGGSESTFSAYGATAAITAFVIGICTPREDLRLCIQHGVSRRSCFLAGLLAAAVSSLVLAVGCEILLAAAQLLTKNVPNMLFTDLYQAIFIDANARSLTFSQHLSATGFTFGLVFSLNVVGSFISLMFYRLPKPWRLVVAIGAPVTLFTILPAVIGIFGLPAGLAEALGRFFALDFVHTPAFRALLFAAVIALFSLFNRLLMKKAPIRAAAK